MKRRAVHTPQQARQTVSKAETHVISTINAILVHLPESRFFFKTA
jgi:hypothetical protein